MDETKLILSEKNSQLDQLNARNSSLEEENYDLVNRIHSITSKILLDIHTQTDGLILSDIHTQTIGELESTKVSSSSKLTDLNTGHVANIAAKFNAKTNVSPVALAANAGGANEPQNAEIAIMNSELKSVKIKNDHLILEKSSLKFKNDALKFENDELKQKNDELNRELAELAQQIIKSIETLPVVPVSSVVEHDTHVATTQTSSGVAEKVWQTRIETCQQELDIEKANAAREIAQLKHSLDEQIDELRKKCAKLEAVIKEEKEKIAKLNTLNKEISFNLSNKNEEYLQLEHVLAEKIKEFKKSNCLFI